MLLRSPIAFLAITSETFNFAGLKVSLRRARRVASFCDKLSVVLLLAFPFFQLSKNALLLIVQTNLDFFRL